MHLSVCLKQSRILYLGFIAHRKNTVHFHTVIQKLCRIDKCQLGIIRNTDRREFKSFCVCNISDKRVAVILCIYHTAIPRRRQNHLARLCVCYIIIGCKRISAYSVNRAEINQCVNTSARPIIGFDIRKINLIRHLCDIQRRYKILRKFRSGNLLFRINLRNIIK